MSLVVERFAGPAEEWDAFVRAQAGGTQSHLFGWKGVVERVFGHRCFYLAARDGSGALAGVLPLVSVRSLAFGHHLVSMPFLNHGGPLGSAEAVEALVAGARSLGRRLGNPLLELRSRAPLEIGMPASHDKVAVAMRIPEEGPDELWRRFPAKLRSQVRRPEKEGVVVRFGAGEVVPFFQVFARNMRDLGTPTHPLSLFREVSSVFGEDAWLGCAYLGGVPVAAGCALRHGDELEMTWASSLREHSRIAPNMLLYWAFMKRAAEQGMRRFDFGRCTPGGGTHRFKLQWGATDEPLWWYRDGADGREAPSQDEGAYGLASRMWKRIPVPIANLIGPRIRAGIPA